MKSNSLSILFIGGLASETQIEEFKANSLKGFQFAAQNLEESIITGLRDNSVNLEVLTIPSLSTFPFGYRILRIPDTDFYFKGENIGWSLGFINLPFLNTPSRKRIHEKIKSWHSSTGGNRVILVYSLNKQLMKIALWAKKCFPDIMIVLVIPDLPRYMGCNRLYEFLGLRKFDIKFIYGHVHEFDGFVILAKDMAKDLKIEDKPYTIMEGIFSDDILPIHNCELKEKIILYTGNIGQRYGIQTLLDAFDFIKDNDIVLWIRGDGEMKSEIIHRAERDNRIKYIDPLGKKELLQLQCKASILINPVSPINDFTHYFFPSKTMTYLSSGRPVLMYELACIPDEYKQHLYFIEGDSPRDMANSILRVLSIPSYEINKKGIEAQFFIVREKCAKKQCKKIINLINSLSY